MKSLILAASFFASFSSNASLPSENVGLYYTNQIIDLMQSMPKNKPPIPDLTNAPSYVKDFYEMNPEQKKTIKQSISIGNKYQYDTAKPITSITDKRLGYHLAAITWIESRACENTGKGKKGHHAYGCFQILYKTAKSRSPESPKRLLVNHLETLQGGSSYALQELEYWLTYHKGDMRKALASYNGGFKYKTKEAKVYSSMVMNTAKMIETNF